MPIRILFTLVPEPLELTLEPTVDRSATLRSLLARVCPHIGKSEIRRPGLPFRLRGCAGVPPYGPGQQLLVCFNLNGDQRRLARPDSTRGRQLVRLEELRVRQGSIDENDILIPPRFTLLAEVR